MLDDSLKNDSEIEREWLESEIGENYKLVETLQEILNEEKEIENLRIAERKRKELIYLREFKRSKSKLNEPNYLNSHPYWGQPFTPLPFIFRVINWILEKRMLRIVGRKLKKNK